MRHAAFVVAFAAVACSAMPALALTHNYLVTLNGTQAGTGSPGTGTASVVLDDVSGAITVSGSFSGLTGTRTDQHIHGPAGVGATASVFFPLSGSGGNSGTISGTGTLTPTQVGYITSGNSYINIHTTTFGGGEIRGQVVPEPASLGLIGLAMAAATRRRRR